MRRRSRQGVHSWWDFPKGNGVGEARTVYAVIVGAELVSARNGTPTSHQLPPTKATTALRRARKRLDRVGGDELRPYNPVHTRRLRLTAVACERPTWKRTWNPAIA